MLKKPITYTDFDGNTVTKDFYFNITKAELALAELESDGTWSQALQRITESNKGSVVLPEFKKIIKWTYGERNGDQFDKSDAAWSRFENSEPWSVLIMELLTNAGAAANFINAVLPADIAARNLEAQAVNGFRPGADTSRPTPPKAGASGGSSDTPVEIVPPTGANVETPQEMEARIRAEILSSQQNVAPVSEPEQGIQHQSEPRHSTFENPEQ